MHSFHEDTKLLQRSSVPLVPLTPQSAFKRGEWQLLCGIVKGEEGGRNRRMSVKEKSGNVEEGGMPRKHGEEKHPLAIMEET